MAILVRFTPSGLTSEQYNAVGQKLQDRGNWPPDGLLAHVGFGTSGDLRVSEVWESREHMDKFAETIMPILEEEGIELSGEPEVIPVEGYYMREASSQPGD